MLVLSSASKTSTSKSERAAMPCVAMNALRHVAMIRSMCHSKASPGTEATETPSCSSWLTLYNAHSAPTTASTVANSP